MMEQVKGQTGGADAAAQARKKQILEAPDTVCARRSTYYVSQRGDDANDGLSPERPRRSFEGLEALPLETLKQYSDVFDEDVYEAIALENCVEGRSVTGGPAPREVARQIACARAQLEALGSSQEKR